ncbi:uncharacterized protein LOC120921998 [Rana temporaria]|uniref:uncharacterized protein LOC120921998 n=1 Tax=Rana temporaria TaxID=8407 RepID=UPI001AACC8CB|nr:uncharacterized protein LOC120921998 [Rana temporaria]
MLLPTKFKDEDRHYHLQYIFLMTLLTGVHCEPYCKDYGEGLITTNEGSVTLQVKVIEEIVEIHWIRWENQNVFFHIVNFCKFEKCCCQIHPKDCCRMENKTYENKLCSCHISSLSSSITFCNVTSKDEGSILADIITKNNKSRCKFDLHIPGENDERTEPQDHTIHIAVIITVVIIAIIFIIGGVVVFIKFRGVIGTLISNNAPHRQAELKLQVLGEDIEQSSPHRMSPGVKAGNNKSNSIVNLFRLPSPRILCTAEAKFWDEKIKVAQL